MNYLKLLLFASIALSLILDLTEAVRKRPIKAGKIAKKTRGRIPPKLKLARRNVTVSNSTQSINVTRTPTTPISSNKMKKLKSKNAFLAKKLRTCQMEMKKIKSCHEPLIEAKEDLEQMTRERNDAKRRVTSLEHLVDGLKEALRREKEESDTLFREKLGSMKSEYEEKIEYLEMIVTGLNYSLIYQQKTAQAFRKSVTASNNARVINMRARFVSKMSNMESTIQVLNDKISKLGKEQNKCLKKLLPGGNGDPKKDPEKQAKKASRKLTTTPHSGSKMVKSEPTFATFTSRMVPISKTPLPSTLSPPKRSILIPDTTTSAKTDDGITTSKAVIDVTNPSMQDESTVDDVTTALMTTGGDVTTSDDVTTAPLTTGDVTTEDDFTTEELTTQDMTEEKTTQDDVTTDVIETSTGSLMKSPVYFLATI